MKSIYIKFIYCILLSLITIGIRAQTLQDDIDYQFAPLNTNKITTGILIDKTLQLSGISSFDGVYDTVCNSEAFRQMYFELYNGRYNKAGIAQSQTILNYTRDLYNQGKIPVMILDYNYNTIKSNALTDGYISYSNGQLHDNTLSFQTPYDVKKAFAAATIFEHTGLNTLNFYFDKTLFFSNASSPITTVEVDFSDGLGYRVVPLTNKTISVTYNTAGDRTLKIRAVINGITRVSKTVIRISNDITAAATFKTETYSQRFIQVTKDYFFGPANTQSSVFFPRWRELVVRAKLLQVESLHTLVNQYEQAA